MKTAIKGLYEMMDACLAHARNALWRGKAPLYKAQALGALNFYYEWCTDDPDVQEELDGKWVQYYEPEFDKCIRTDSNGFVEINMMGW